MNTLDEIHETKFEIWYTRTRYTDSPVDEQDRDAVGPFPAFIGDRDCTEEQRRRAWHYADETTRDRADKYDAGERFVVESHTVRRLALR